MSTVNTVLIGLVAFLLILTFTMLYGYMQSLERKIDRLERQLAEIRAEFAYWAKRQ